MNIELVVATISLSEVIVSVMFNCIVNNKLNK